MYACSVLAGTLEIKRYRVWVESGLAVSDRTARSDNEFCKGDIGRLRPRCDAADRGGVEGPAAFIDSTEGDGVRSCTGSEWMRSGVVAGVGDDIGCGCVSCLLENKLNNIVGGIVQSVAQNKELYRRR